MRYSTLTPESTSRDVIDAFGGYNHNARISENEFYDMKNLTSDNYPILSPRKKRGIYKGVLEVQLLGNKYLDKPDYTANKFYKNVGDTTPEYQLLTSDSAPEDWDDNWATDYYEEIDHKYNGFISKDALCYVDGTSIYINGNKITGFTLSDTPKQLVSIGAYIVVLPDKKYINTMDYTDKGEIEANFESLEGDTITFSLCKADGTTYTSTINSDTEPENPDNLDLWIDTSKTPHALKQYSKSSGVWVQIATTYVKIACTGIGGLFNKYDGVTISGIDSTVEQLKDLESQTSVLWDVYHDAETPSNDYIVVVGILDSVATQTNTLTVTRNMPDMDFVIESGNRLWGCRYGLNADNKVVNEIYASKLGDFKNWNCFMGVSTDSYTASCGSDGQFTGAITHLGYPLFFKENYLHKVYGNYPANYQIQTTVCRGVQKGCGKSLAIVNETLYYKSRNGVCVYDGSLPTEISNIFGDIHYTALDDTNSDFLRNGAVAGAHRNKYYISMKSEKDNDWYLFVYDTLARLWHKEDNLRVDYFCANRDELYYIDHNNATHIKTMLGSGDLEETSVVNWMAETGVIGVATPNKKYVSRLNIRMSLDVGSSVKFFAQYDSGGEWEYISTITGNSLRSFSVPIRPKRCDHLRIRIEGIGDAKIYSIVKTYEYGSDE